MFYPAKMSTEMAQTAIGEAVNRYQLSIEGVYRHAPAIKEWAAKQQTVTTEGVRNELRRLELHWD